MAGVLFRGGPFRIATFIPDVTIEAVGQDALGITGAPVETGATMTDHSFKLPVRLEMVAGWSDSSAGYDGYIRDVYQQLLRLQATRLPFQISTGRRLYRNMLMESITDPIGPATMYAMVPRITFRELIISQTQTRDPGVATVGEGAPPSLQPAVNRGEVQTQPVGSQVFAGAYSPGNLYPGAYNVDGTPAVGQTFVGNGLTLPGADLPLAQNPNLSGLSPPPLSITLPELSVGPAPASVGGLQAAGPDQYNVFGGGP